MAWTVALDMVKTKYIASCTNDLAYYPDWLNALIANAEQHDAAAVAPVTLIGPSILKLIIMLQASSLWEGTIVES